MWLIQKERRLLSILSTVFKAFKKEKNPWYSERRNDFRLGYHRKYIAIKRCINGC